MPRRPITSPHSTLSPTSNGDALGDPERIRAQLESEGLRFIDGKADPAVRVSLRELDPARGGDAPAADVPPDNLAGVLPRVQRDDGAGG